MKYTLINNGDSLERAYANYIIENFSTYELVWQNYIGNVGSNKIAPIIGYDFERNKKRIKFSQHSYTVLQSVILLKRLVEKYENTNKSIKKIGDLLDLQDLLILFFGHVGRIFDNLNQCELCLITNHSKDCTSSLRIIYHKRHLIIHGKALPFIFEENGVILIPILGVDSLDRGGWNHKDNFWEDIETFKSETVEITIRGIYTELLQKLNQIFGVFNKDILNELEKLGLQIEYNISNFAELNSTSFEASGSNKVGSFGSSGYGLP